MQSISRPSWGRNAQRASYVTVLSGGLAGFLPVAILLAGSVMAQTPSPSAAPGGEDLADFFVPKALEFESLRDEKGRYTLGLRIDENDKLGVSSFSAVIRGKTGDEEITVDEAQSLSYDPATRMLQVRFGRNEAKVSEISGTLTAVPREFDYLHRFEGKVTLEASKTEPAKVEPITMIGSTSRLKGKKNCFVDLYAGANLGAVTLKARYVKDRGDWVTPTAAEQGWTVARRRIDFIKGEDEFDVIAPPGRELRALQAASAMPDVDCISVGADEGDNSDGLRIIDVPKGRLLTDPRAGTTIAPDKVRDLFATAKLDNRQAQVDVETTNGGQPFVVSLRAPGRFFGLTQDADKPHRIRVSVEFGLSPGRLGDIAESLRFTRKDAAKAGNDNEFQPLVIRTNITDDVSAALEEWQSRYLEALAKITGGQVN